jgi:hypothetical protein
MRRAWTLLASMLLICLGAHATTVIPVSVEQLTRASQSVVIGQAEDSWTDWNPQHTIISTYTRFRVSQALKGELGKGQTAQTITIKQMGGRAAHYEQKVAGIRQLVAGEAAVLFLRPSEANDGTQVITGLMQGNFRLSRTKAGELMAGNGVSGVKTYDPSNKNAGEYSGASMTLNELVAHVRKAAQQ